MIDKFICNKVDNCHASYICHHGVPHIWGHRCNDACELDPKARCVAIIPIGKKPSMNPAAQVSKRCPVSPDGNHRFIPVLIESIPPTIEVLQELNKSASFWVMKTLIDISTGYRYAVVCQACGMHVATYTE